MNIERYRSLNHDDFDRELNAFLLRHSGFVPCENLNHLKGLRGTYLMVLDEYRQVYIGISKDMHQRIMRHWSYQKHYDRLLWGDPLHSTLSIDSFRPLDTTRIYARVSEGSETTESGLVSDFPRKYLLNRAPGGIFEPTYGGASLPTEIAVAKFNMASPLSSWLKDSGYTHDRIKGMLAAIKRELDIESDCANS